MADYIYRKLRASEKASDYKCIYASSEKERFAWLKYKDKGVSIGKSVQDEIVELRNRLGFGYTCPLE